MIGEFFKRLVNGVVFLLAVLTFFLVPIGRKTGAQHAVAIFSTAPAKEAAAAFAGVARRVSAEALVEIDRLRNAQIKPREPRATPQKPRPPS